MLIHFGTIGDDFFGKVLGGAGVGECSFILDMFCGVLADDETNADDEEATAILLLCLPLVFIYRTPYASTFAQWRSGLRVCENDPRNGQPD